MPSVPSDPVSSPSRLSGNEARPRAASKEGRPPFRDLIEESMPERPTEPRSGAAKKREPAAPHQHGRAEARRDGSDRSPKAAAGPDAGARAKPAGEGGERRKDAVDSEPDAADPASANDAKSGAEEGKAIASLLDIAAAALDAASPAPNVGQAAPGLDPAAAALAAAGMAGDVETPLADDAGGDAAEAAPADGKAASAGARSNPALDPSARQDPGAAGAKGHSPLAERAEQPIDARADEQGEATAPKEPARSEPRDAEADAPPEPAGKPAEAAAQNGDAQRASAIRNEPAPPWLQTMSFGERAEPLAGRDGLSAIHDLAKAGQHALPADSAERVVRVTEVGAMIAARAAEGKSRFDIRLDPPELGRVEVRMEIKPDGDVRSHLIVERAETLDLLRRDAPQLERVLQSAGLKSDGGIEFSLRDPSGGQGGWNGHASRQQPGAHTLLAMAEPSPASVSAGALSAYSVRARSGIDIQV